MTNYQLLFLPPSEPSTFGQGVKSDTLSNHLSPVKESPIKKPGPKRAGSPNKPDRISEKMKPEAALMTEDLVSCSLKVLQKASAVNRCAAAARQSFASENGR